MKITKQMAESSEEIEHPDDRELRLAGEKYGKAHAATFCDRHAHKMEKLIGLYADAEAEALLAQIREEFWSVNVLDREENRNG